MQSSSPLFQLAYWSLPCSRRTFRAAVRRKSIRWWRCDTNEPMVSTDFCEFERGTSYELSSQGVPEGDEYEANLYLNVCSARNWICERRRTCYTRARPADRKLKDDCAETGKLSCPSSRGYSSTWR